MTTDTAAAVPVDTGLTGEGLAVGALAPSPGLLTTLFQGQERGIDFAVEDIADGGGVLDGPLDATTTAAPLDGSEADLVPTAVDDGAQALIGGVMAGVAATLYMIRIGSTRQNAGFILGVKAFTAAVSAASATCAARSSAAWSSASPQNWGAAVFGTQWQDVVAFVLLVLILLVRPTGILGESLAKARA